MKRYLILMGGMAAFFLLLFFIVMSLDVPLLTDPTLVMSQGGMMAAFVGVGLLIVDVVLPVPSSIIMVLHGTIFGVWTGTLLSLIGSVGASLFGFAIGRHRGGMLDRFMTAEERAHGDYLLRRWGLLAIVVTRPVPILAETVSIIAGTSSLGWGSITLATLAGSIPPALFYAMTGAAIANLRT